LDDNEHKDIFQQLINMLPPEMQLWVIKEVEDSLAEDEKQTFDEMDDEDSKQLILFDGFAFEKTAFSSTKASKAQKRLIMLIDTISQAVVYPAECKYFLLPYFHEKGIREIIFLSPDGNGRKLLLDKDSIQKQLEAARQLGHVLQSLHSSIVQEI